MKDVGKVEEWLEQSTGSRRWKEEHPLQRRQRVLRQRGVTRLSRLLMDGDRAQYFREVDRLRHRLRRRSRAFPRRSDRAEGAVMLAQKKMTNRVGCWRVESKEERRERLSGAAGRHG